MKWRTLFVILLLGFTIYLCFRNYHLRQMQSHVTKSETDTVYIYKEFKPVSVFKDKLNPGKILIYKPAKFEDSILGCSNPAKDFSFHSNDFKVSNNSNSVQGDSLVQFILEKDKLSISSYSTTDSIYSTRIYPIDPLRYTYNWYQGEITYKKNRRINLKPYVYAKYRPFNNFTDIGFGISLKTQRINYNLGINGFYYPGIKKNPGWDIELSLKYNF